MDRSLIICIQISITCFPFVNNRNTQIPFFVPNNKQHSAEMEREREREGRGHALNSGAAPRLPSQDKAAAAAVDREAAAVSSAVERVTQADVAKELAHYNTHSPVVAKAVAAHRRKQHAQNPTDTDVLSTTLLEACISQGDVDTVQLLVDNGVDVNARLGASYDTSPLRMACKYGQLEVVKLLVAHRVRVNGDDDRGGRPGYSKPVLAIASSHGHLEIVRWLVENGGARVNDETIAGVSPLADAVRRGNLQIARYLVAKGANTMFKSRPWSLWYLAIKLGRLAMLKCFAESKRDDLIQNDHLRLGVLECAAEKGDIGILQSLLALNVFRRLELNECLAKAQSVEFVKLLASKGADVNAYSARGDSPLHTAICNRLVEVIETLLSLGADVNQPGSQGSEHSAIHTMAVCDQLDLLKLVRQICGDAADFRAPGQRYGSTPLHLAAFAGHVDIVRFLLKVLSSSDVDINSENYSHETPLILLEKGISVWCSCSCLKAQRLTTEFKAVERQRSFVLQKPTGATLFSSCASMARTSIAVTMMVSLHYVLQQEEGMQTLSSS